MGRNARRGPGHRRLFLSSVPTSVKTASEREMKKSPSLPLLVLTAWLILEARVDAYLDAGTGSLLLQALLGGVAAVGMFGRMYWHKISSLFRRKGLDGDKMPGSD